MPLRGRPLLGESRGWDRGTLCQGKTAGPQVSESPVPRPLQELGLEAKCPKEKQVLMQQWSEGIPLSRPRRKPVGPALLRSMRGTAAGLPADAAAWQPLCVSGPGPGQEPR